MIKSTAFILAPLLLLITIPLSMYLYRMLHKSDQMLKYRGLIKIGYIFTIIVLLVFTFGTYSEYSHESTFHQLFPYFEDAFNSTVIVDYPQVGRVQSIDYLYFANNKLASGNNGKHSFYDFYISLFIHGSDSSIRARFNINNINGAWTVEAQK